MERRSLFAVVDTFGNMRPPYYSILQLDPECSHEQIRMIKVDEKVRFNVTMEPPHSISYIRWLFSPPKGSSEDLYMVPNWRFSNGDDVKPLHGYKFNFSAGSFVPINLPDYYKDDAFVVSLRGIIYLISHYYSKNDWYSKRPIDFQCYDPVKDSWKPLEPFPSQAVGADHNLATAVWDDTILLIGGYAGIWAYDVNGNKWYPVEVEDRRCRLIVGGIVRGEAVVLGNFIYALTIGSVVVLSIKKESIGNHLVFKCSLISDNRMDPILSGNNRANGESRHLVHLGKGKFCVVQSCDLFGSDRQPIQVTYIKFKKDNSLMVIDEYFQWVKIQRSESFSDEFCVRLCFSLPKGAATALKQGKKSFNLDPCPEEDYASNRVQEEEIVTPVQEEEDEDNDSSQTNIIEEEEDEDNDSSQTNISEEEEDEDSDSSQTNIIDKQLGRSIYVRELPPNATLSELEMGLKKFGPIMRHGIQARINEEGKRCAYVEFESVTSKKLAIEASLIRIGDCPVILEQRLTDHTLGDCNSTQAVGNSSFGKNKIKKHGEGSRSKTTCAGHNGGGFVYQPRRPKGKKRRNKVADLESRVSGLENDLKKVKERLDFLEEGRK